MRQVQGNLDALIASIHRQAQQRSIAAETEARRRADALLAEADSQARERRVEVLHQGEREADALRRRLLAQGELRRKQLWLMAREKAIAEVFESAEVRLRELVTAPDYLEILEKLALQAAADMAEATVCLAADPVGHALLTAEIVAGWNRPAMRFELAAEPAAIWGGLIASCGRQRYDASFATGLAVARESLREAVYARLSGS